MFTGSCFLPILKSSEVSSLPKITFLVNSFLFLQTLTLTFLPTSVFATIAGNSFICLIFSPLNSKIISPSLIPALSEGLFSATLTTNAPLGSSNSSASAISWVTYWILTPNHPLFVSPNSISWLITVFALLEGIENPIPIEPFLPSIAVLIPITFPSKSNKGPPEFPEFIDASVWIKSSYLDKPIDLFLAEIIPEVTVPPKPKGFPIAITQSPILALSESPKETGINFSSVSSCNTAISISGSAPKTLALNSSSPLTLTIISSAPWITWLFVTTIPLSSIINPEPSAADCLSWGVPNSLNISSSGDPGGNWNGNDGLVFVTTVWVDEIFTTDGINLSAKSAKDAGTVLELDWIEKFKVNINVKNIILIFFILTFNIINNYKSYNCKN